MNSNSKTKNNGVSLVLPSAIASKTLWYNKKINIDNKSIYLYGISEKGSNDAGHLLNESQKLKSWDKLKQECSFHQNRRFLLMLLLHAIRRLRKNDLSNVKENIHNLVFQDHHLIRKQHMCFLNRISCKEIYNFLFSQKEETTSSLQHYQQKSLITISARKMFTY